MRKNTYNRNLKWTIADLLPCYCYAIKTSRRTIRWLVSQPSSADKRADMSELQCHHCVFEQTKWVNHIRTAVRDHPLKCRLPNRISCDVFDRWFCKAETTVCETLLSCAKRLGGLTVTTLPGAWRLFNPALPVRKIFLFRAVCLGL